MLQQFSQGEGTPRKLPTAIPENCYQPMWIHGTQQRRANWGNGDEIETLFAEDRKTMHPGNLRGNLLTVALPRCFLVSLILMYFCDSYVHLGGIKDWWSCKFCFYAVNWTGAWYIIPLKFRAIHKIIYLWILSLFPLRYFATYVNHLQDVCKNFIWNVFTPTLAVVRY
jgi:hypothetical protein